MKGRRVGDLSSRSIGLDGAHTHRPGYVPGMAIKAWYRERLIVAWVVVTLGVVSYRGGLAIVGYEATPRPLLVVFLFFWSLAVIMLAIPWKWVRGIAK